MIEVQTQKKFFLLFRKLLTFFIVAEMIDYLKRDLLDVGFFRIETANDQRNFFGF